MISSKNTLVYGFSKEEVKKLKIYATGIKIISEDMINLKLKDILNEDNESEPSETSFEQRVLIFNGYKEHELKPLIRKIRQEFPGVILALVTPISINWSFKYLLTHLLEEKEEERKRSESKVE